MFLLGCFVTPESIRQLNQRQDSLEAKMDELLEAAQTETDMDKRIELYKQIQELWTTECPTIPFTQGSLYVVTQKNVTGVTLAPYMLFPYFLLSK